MSALSVSKLTVGYGGAGGAGDVIKSLDLEVPAGTLSAVVGPNGSGKSTLLKTISGYLRPSGGSVRLCGLDPHALTPAERSALVTYCGDEPEPAFDFTVRETVLLGRVARGASGEDEGAAEQAMRELGILELRDRTVTSLSSGERQRAYLARAVYQDPQVLLLDEPTAHLDMAYELQVMEMVLEAAHARGKTVLAVVHDLNLALRFAERLFFLKGGRVLHSLTPDQVDAGAIREVYGVESCIMRHPVLGCPIAVPTSLAGTKP